MAEKFDMMPFLLFPFKLREILADSGMVKSKGEADRMIKQNAVEIRYDRDEDPIPLGQTVLLPRTIPFFLRVGRSWKKIVIPGPEIMATIEDLPDVLEGPCDPQT